MRIVADANVARVSEAFADVGELVLRPGRSITPDELRGADALLTRSITRVGPQLLDDSSVRFVGSTTIGTDHVDKEYLKKRNITFTSAPGSTAPPVAEWFVAALLVLARRRGWHVQDKTLGVIGIGNVGRRVARFSEAMGMQVIRNDPPLARSTGDPIYRPIEELTAVDIITVHTPLTRNGADATFHLIDADFLARLKPGVIIINAARGAIVDGDALRAALESGHVSDALLDVWEAEPKVDLALLDKVAIGTPHVAGHSLDGKVRGTEMIYRAFCTCFGLTPTWNPWPTLPPAHVAELAVDATNRHDDDVLREVVLSANAVEVDDTRLRAVADQPPEQRAEYFDHLRATYPMQREFPATTVTLQGGTADLAAKLTTLGFRVQS